MYSIDPTVNLCEGTISAPYLHIQVLQYVHLLFEFPGNDKEALGINVLMPLVAKAELSNTEIEAIIEVLLNKQTSGTTDWTEGR